MVQRRPERVQVGRGRVAVSHRLEIGIDNTPVFHFGLDCTGQQERQTHVILIAAEAGQWIVFDEPSLRDQPRGLVHHLDLGRRMRRASEAPLGGDVARANGLALAKSLFAYGVSDYSDVDSDELVAGAKAGLNHPDVRAFVALRLAEIANRAKKDAIDSFEVSSVEFTQSEGSDPATKFGFRTTDPMLAEYKEWELTDELWGDCVELKNVEQESKTSSTVWLTMGEIHVGGENADEVGKLFQLISKLATGFAEATA